MKALFGDDIHRSAAAIHADGTNLPHIIGNVGRGVFAAINLHPAIYDAGYLNLRRAPGVHLTEGPLPLAAVTEKSEDSVAPMRNVLKPHSNLSLLPGESFVKLGAKIELVAFLATSRLFFLILNHNT
jgi:hypothetical protein